MRRIFVAFTSVSEFGHGIPSLYLYTLFPRLRSQIGNECHGISGGILRGVYESYLGHRIDRRVLERMLWTTRRQLRQLYFCFFFSLKKPNFQRCERRFRSKLETGLLCFPNTLLCTVLAVCIARCSIARPCFVYTASQRLLHHLACTPGADALFVRIT